MFGNDLKMSQKTFYGEILLSSKRNLAKNNLLKISHIFNRIFH